MQPGTRQIWSDVRVSWPARQGMAELPVGGCGTAGLRRWVGGVAGDEVPHLGDVDPERPGAVVVGPADVFCHEFQEVSPGVEVHPVGVMGELCGVDGVVCGVVVVGFVGVVPEVAVDLPGGEGQVGAGEDAVLHVVPGDMDHVGGRGEAVDDVDAG